MLYLIFTFLLPFAWAQSPTSCQATYDELRIPHLETKSLEEFYYCFGYHHAVDRAWEMDFLRRVGEGRNAEILGLSHLKSDLMMRLLDLPTVAHKLWSEFSPERKKWLVQYTAGVNEGFKTGKNAKEFTDLQYEPEAWKPENTLLILLLQSFDQTRKTFFRDYEEEKNKEKWGNAAATLFDEDHMPWESTILKQGEYPKATHPKTSSVQFKKTMKFWSEFPSVFGEESGSNNWVVDARKSKTGKAILANDPHLDLKTPMFWYWMDLKSPTIHLIGGSVPGVPIIASGTNGKVAWGLTNSYLNSADVYFVKGTSKEDVVSLRPKVMIKFWFFKVPFFFKTFEHLKTGHRVLPLDVKTDDKIVLAWTGFSLKPEDIYPMFDIPQMNDVMEMDRTLAKVGLPSWNFVFADTKGDIGYHLVGKVYRHTKKIPYGMSVKTLDELKHEEFLQDAEKPQLLKPKRGYISTANNRHWPEDAAFYGGRGYSYSFRNLRIDELLQGPQDSESFKRIQCDHQVMDAKFFLPRISKSIHTPELNEWDQVARDDSKELPLYRRFMDLLMEKWEVNEYALYKMLDNPSIKQVSEMNDIYQVVKNELQGKTWGELHRLTFPHMSKNENWNFAEEIPGVGDTHSVDPGTAKWNDDKQVYEQFSGASMRMIIEMSKPVKIQLVLPGLNRNYTERPVESPWKAWKNCQYRTIKF